MSNKKWKETTRGGNKVRIYAKDGGGEFPIHGAVFLSGGWHVQTWTANGFIHVGVFSEPNDLIPDRREVWVNEYPEGVFGSPQDSIEEAKAKDNGDSIGVVKFVEVLEESQ